jgi:hypothetical protein
MEITMDNPISYILLLLIGYGFYRIYQEKKIVNEIKNIPKYHPKLLGVYVMFKGIVQTPNQHLTPLSTQSCAFYNFKVKGLYQVKKKKPNKGYESISNILHKEDSDGFELLHNNHKVGVKFINKDRSTKVQFNIHSKVTKSKQANENYPFFKKFSSYEYHESYIKEGEEITVYGRLTEEAGLPVITNTYSDKLPFILFLGDTEHSAYKPHEKSIFWMLSFVGIGIMVVLFLSF